MYHRTALIFSYLEKCLIHFWLTYSLSTPILPQPPARTYLRALRTLELAKIFSPIVGIPGSDLHPALVGNLAPLSHPVTRLPGSCALRFTFHASSQF